jgi:hypothetical protein
MDAIVADPAKFGFSNVADDPYPGNPIPGYVWFGDHPSTQMHQVMAHFAEQCLLDHFSPSRGKGEPPAQVNALSGLVRAGKDQ